MERGVQRKEGTEGVMRGVYWEEGVVGEKEGVGRGVYWEDGCSRREGGVWREEFIGRMGGLGGLGGWVWWEGLS